VDAFTGTLSTRPLRGAHRAPSCERNFHVSSWTAAEATRIKFSVNDYWFRSNLPFGGGSVADRTANDNDRDVAAKQQAASREFDKLGNDILWQMNRGFAGSHPYIQQSIVLRSFYLPSNI
jgi:hypothetical protein